MDQIARIQKAIDYIEDHLKEDLQFHVIAENAAFSPWHFQRVFPAVVGESLKGYIRKRRLASALEDLRTTDKRIIDIAIDHQFESQESFTRAIKTQFGQTPGDLRAKSSRSIHALVKPKITIEYLDHLFGGMTMQPRIVEIAEKYIVGLETNFISIHSPEANTKVVLPALWMKFFPRRGEINEQIPGAMFGVCQAIKDETLKSHPEEFNYVAGVEVRSVENVPEAMIVKKIPAGRYAVFTHKGKLDTLNHTLNYIFGSWLTRSGEEFRDAPDFEYYDSRFKHGSDDSELDIYIPIK